MTRQLVGRLFFVLASCAIIVVAGGGITFLRRPVGILYLVLSVVWWLLAVVRQRGVTSTYDQKQRAIVTVFGVVTVPLLWVASPWEYAHFTGPVLRDGLVAWVGLALFATGVALQATAMWALRGLYTVRLGIQPGHHLVTGGPYRWVRHPGYLSYILAMTGMGLAMSSLIGLGLVVLIVPFLLWRIEREEEMLATEFGAKYQTYAQQTKRLIPLVY